MQYTLYLDRNIIHLIEDDGTEKDIGLNPMNRDYQRIAKHYYSLPVEQRPFEYEFEYYPQSSI